MKRETTFDRRTCSIALWITCAIAVVGLPHDLFAPEWVAAFVAPAVLLYVLREHLRLGLARSLVAAGTAHVGTILLAHATAGPIESETALGCSLLPPLAFLAARRQGEDVIWSLFLALCTLLIAIILGAPPAWLVWSFLAAAFVTLQLETVARSAARRRAWHGAFGRRWLAIGGLATTLIATLAMCVLAMRVLSALPSPGRDPVQAGQQRDGRRAPTSSVGLSDRFEFGLPAERLLDLQSDELVRVRGVDGPVQRDLYLRTAHFELAGLDRWSKAQPNERGLLPGSDVTHRGSLAPGLPVRELEIEISGAAERFLFLPPGTVAMTGIAHVIGNVRQETFLRVQRGRARYRVTYQSRRELAAARPYDPALENLARLPLEFDPHLGHFHRLLRDAGGARGATPAELAARISAMLQDRCTYELREPDGPFGEHSILNFVSGDRTGFCMHFASTLAICLRLAGVPCRVAVGLYAGNAELAPDDVLVLGSQHAHAWVEIPLEELGWIVFDPTPPSQAGAASTQAAARAASDAAGMTVARWLDSWSVWVLIGVAATILALGRRGIGSGEVESVTRRVDPDLAASFRMLLDALEPLAPRIRGHSLWQYAASFAGDRALPVEAIESAFAAYEEVRFGRRPFDAPRRARLAAALDAVRARCTANA